MHCWDYVNTEKHGDRWKCVFGEMTTLLYFLAKPRASGIDERNFKAIRCLYDQFMYSIELFFKLRQHAKV